jgi:hypothetical protein
MRLIRLMSAFAITRNFKTWCIVVGLFGSAYFCWALHRVSDNVLSVDPAWPRGWPYPNGWLFELSASFDVMNPVDGDALKLHGELARVRGFVFSVFLTFFSIGLWGLAGFLYRHPQQGGH